MDNEFELREYWYYREGSKSFEAFFENEPVDGLDPRNGDLVGPFDSLDEALAYRVAQKPLPPQLDPIKLFAALHELWANQHYHWEYATNQTYHQCKVCNEVADEMADIHHKRGCLVAATLEVLRGEEK